MKASLQDLGLAYRKVKVDLFYSSGIVAEKLVDYERCLVENLKTLQSALKRGGEGLLDCDDFIGGWEAIPKKLTFRDKPENGYIIHSDPGLDWKRNRELKPEAEFRLMADVSMDFHVLSSLWVMSVGQVLEGALSDHAMGSRLRRTRSGNYNPYSLGSFKPYFHPYKTWREGGIRAMKEALDRGEPVIAVTADIRSFYHNLNPEFLTSTEFMNDLGVQLDNDQIELNAFFVKALQAWAEITPLNRGLPVGLPASAVVANLALYAFDRAIVSEVNPIYYGRYVDDMILVMGNGANHQSSKGVWEWLFARFKGVLDWSENEPGVITYTPDLLASSTIEFAEKKTKCFLLEGETGKLLVNSIRKEINERSSEWRSMPRLPDDPTLVGTDIAAATQSDGERADNLRKSDGLSLKRSSFAMRLRDYEAYTRDLEPKAWVEHRHAFLRSFQEQVLHPQSYFDFSVYFPRVLSIAVLCRDWEWVNTLVQSVHDIVKETALHCTWVMCGRRKEHPDENYEVYAHWDDRLTREIRETILKALASEDHPQGFGLSTELQEWVGTQDLDPQKAWEIHKEWFWHDLAHSPCRNAALPREILPWGFVAPDNPYELPEGDAHKILPYELATQLGVISSLFEGSSAIYGILFSVRPFSLAELQFLLPDAYSPESVSRVHEWIYALRGFREAVTLPVQPSQGQPIYFHDPDPAYTKVRVAVTSWKTESQSWVASVMQESDPDTTRYRRLNDLVDSVMSCRSPIDYLVFGELSIPPRWYIRVASKLQHCRISLIAGVEYIHGSGNVVHNQVWAAISHQGLGFPSYSVYRQDKQAPAHHEREGLGELNNCFLEPIISWDDPPVLFHRGHLFSFLVCSELTNIAYRASLRGKIDTLFVPEWNRDLESFESLVEAAALDIHAYVVQCNDRSYGDSRIRYPAKDRWKRDVVRIKGGNNDYFVVGTIDIQELRAFQSNFLSPPETLKPVPDGFRMETNRRTLPTYNQDRAND